MSSPSKNLVFKKVIISLDCHVKLTLIPVQMNPYRDTTGGHIRDYYGSLVKCSYVSSKYTESHSHGVGCLKDCKSVTLSYTY